MTIKMKNENLTVLHVATLNQPISPDLGYGPIETVIYNIDKGLHSLGYRSIIACSGDSRVAGEHYVTVEQSIGDYWSKDTPKRSKDLDLHLSRALDRAKMGDIDVIHTHDAKTLEYIYDGIFNMHIPIVMTLHLPAKDILMKADYKHRHNSLSSPLVYCVPISEYQKQQYNGLVKTDSVVHHGIGVEEYPLKEKPDKGSYLFTIGRVTRDKGQDKAIEVAKRTGSKLIIAGCVQNKPADREFFADLQNSIDLLVDVGKQPVDNTYYERVIKPLLDCDKQIIYIGEISSEHKKQWYRHARATLFPIQWGEPFGLVLIESMACGTPAIAFNKGAVPEIMLDGKTGFVVDSVSEMIKAVDRIDDIDPHKCRRHVRDHFSITSMAYKYSGIYRQIIEGHKISNCCNRLSPGNLSKSLHHGPIAT
jgi:glycosyltransferase involved in cell wall biosynthesis